MNYRYIPEKYSRIRAILDRNPRATLQEIWNSLPNAGSMSLDHLALTVGRLGTRRDIGSLK